MTTVGQTVTSTAGSDSEGFTLIELVTVLMIFGLMAFIALPRFPRSESISGQDRMIEWFGQQDERLRYQADRHQQSFAINISMSEQRIWVTHAAMTPEEIELAVAQGISLPDDLRIDGVFFPLDNPDGSETTVQIRYFPQGVSDMVEITISEDGRTAQRIHIEPFLGMFPTPLEESS